MTYELKYLDDYLDHSDFRAALRTLAPSFRASVGLPEDLDELGLVCPDVVAAADYLQDTYPGMGTFAIAEGSAARFDQNGQAIHYRTRVGFAYYQDVLLELAEAGTGSDIFSTHLDPQGRITLHHMGYFSRGTCHEINGIKYAAQLERLGYQEPEWSAKVDAGIGVHVAIYDTYRGAEDLSLEFLDFRFLGLPVDYPRKAAQLFGEFQNTVGPRVLYLPGADHGLHLQWSLHGSAQLHAPPSEVWKAITDPEALSQWLNAKVTLEKPGQGGGPGDVGAVRRLQMTLDNTWIDITQTVTESEPNLLLRYNSADRGIFNDGQTTMTVTGAGDHSELVWQTSFVPDETFTGYEIMKKGDEWVASSLDRLADRFGGRQLNRELIPEFVPPPTESR